MTRRLAAILAVIVLLLGGATYAVASTGSQPVTCDYTAGTLSCPIPQPDPTTVTTTASTTATVTADPVTVFTTATATTTVNPPTVTVPGPTTTVTRTTTKTVTATPSTTASTTSPASSTTTTPPVGSGKPSAANTGVPAGTVLTASGGITASTAGQVIDGKDVTGGITVTAKNVTIRNSRVKGSGGLWCINVTSTGSVTIQDSEIVGGCENGIGFDNWKALRVNLHGTYGDGVKLGSNVTLQDSYIHGLAPAAGAHSDGGQLQSGETNITVKHNTITVADTAGSTSGNAALFMAPDLGPSSPGPVLVDGNWLDGGNYTLYFVDGNNGQYHQGGATFTGNRFGSSHQYGYSNVNEPITQSGNVVDATGAPLTL